MPSKLSHRAVALVLIIIFFGFLYGYQNPLENFFRRYEKLTGHYEKILKDRPKSIKFKIELAEFYYNFNDYQKAVNILKGINTDKAKIILAKALVKMRDYSQAIEIFEQLKFTPKDCEYRYLWAQTLEEKNLFPKAIEVYAKTAGPFKKLAQQRLRAIQVRLEENIPSEILEISGQAQSFINESKEEAAVFLLVDENIEITDSNTSISTVHVIQKILEERGKELAEVDLGYDSTYERVELEFARTITKDKKVIYAGKENIRDVSRYLNFPLYSNSRAFIISMPSVDVGAFVEYKVKIYSSKLVDKDNFNFTYRLREKYPVFKANFKLNVPNSKTVNFKFFNKEYAESADLAPSLTEKNNIKIYSWNFDRIKPIIPEYAMPPDSLVNPAVLISSFSSWNDIYEWWHSLYKDKIKASREIEELVKNITKDIPESIDRAKKIYEYVAKNIRYVAVEYGDSGYEPHYAKEVLLNRYGDCKDQAILLTAMLRAAGIKAYPALIPTRQVYSIDENFPSINFNHAICALKTDEDFIFMDPTAETTSFRDLPLGDQERLVMVFLDDGYKLVTTKTAKDNEVKYEMDMVINAEENAEITRVVASKGFFASGYRGYLKYSHPAQIEEDIQKKMVEISSFSRLLNYEIKNVDDFDKDPELRYNFKSEKFLNPAGNLRIVPALDQIYLDYSLIGKEARNFTLDFDGIYVKSAKVKITLPQDLKVEYLPSSRVLENSWFKLEVSYRQFNGQIDFSQKFSVKERFVEKSCYQEFKKRFEEALYLLKEEIILKSNAE